MDWILNHMQFVLAVGGALAYWLNERRKAATEEAPPPHQSKTFDDPELAERTRKIREEIQRKIEQRARGYAEVQPAATATERVTPPPVVRASSHLDAQRQAEILEEQATLMEQLREAELMKAAARKRLAFEESTADSGDKLRTETRVTVVDDLRSPAALRRAFILREVLGPPVALR